MVRRRYVQAKAGEGVHFPYGVPSHKELERIKMLVDMNKRRDEYLGARAVASLKLLAEEYKSKGMPMMAVEIKAEARKISRRKKRNDERRVSKVGGGGGVAAGVCDGVGTAVRL